MHSIIETLKPVIKGLGLSLGPDCEVVLHDVSDPSGPVIAAIENGHISGRSIGTADSGYALQMLQRAQQERGRHYMTNYLTRTPDGRPIRSTTLYIRDAEGNIVAYLCLNYDMTRAEIVKQLAHSLTATEEAAASEETPMLGVDAVERGLRSLRDRVGKPLHLCTKVENLELIGQLDEEGFFLIKGAVEQYAQEAGKTKYTIYLYLREVRRNKARGL